MRQLAVIGKIAHRPKRCGLFSALPRYSSVATVNTRTTVTSAAPIAGTGGTGREKSTRNPVGIHRLCNDHFAGGMRSRS
jgi:hypothetical protein